MRIVIGGSSELACLIAKYIEDETSHVYTLLADKSLDIVRGETSLNVSKVDYLDTQSVRHALIGADTVISVISGSQEATLAQATLDNGIRRFLPVQLGGLASFCHSLCPVDIHRAGIRTLLQSHGDSVESCLLICGVLYEHFQPNGLSLLTNENFNVDSNVYPIDATDMTAMIPVDDDSSSPRQICLTAVQDLAMCVVKMLDLAVWPKQIRIYSCSMSVQELLACISAIREEPFRKLTRHDEASMQSAFQIAVEKGDLVTQRRLHYLIELARDNANYEENQLSALCPSSIPLRFDEWLLEAWRSEE